MGFTTVLQNVSDSVIPMLLVVLTGWTVRFFKVVDHGQTVEFAQFLTIILMPFIGFAVMYEIDFGSGFRWMQVWSYLSHRVLCFLLCSLFCFFVYRGKSWFAYAWLWFMAIAPVNYIVYGIPIIEDAFGAEATSVMFVWIVFDVFIIFPIYLSFVKARSLTCLPRRPSSLKEDIDPNLSFRERLWHRIYHPESDEEEIEGESGSIGPTESIDSVQAIPFLMTTEMGIQFSSSGSQSSSSESVREFDGGEVEFDIDSSDKSTRESRREDSVKSEINTDGLESGKTEIDEEREAVMSDLQVKKPSFLLTLWIAVKCIVTMHFLYGCILGLLWCLISAQTGWKFPVILAKFVNIFVTCITGVALYDLGCFMAENHLINCKLRRLVWLLLLKHVISPLLMIPVSWAFGLSSVESALAFVSQGIPVPTAIFVIGANFGFHGGALASFLTFGSFVIFPDMLFLMWIATKIYDWDLT